MGYTPNMPNRPAEPGRYGFGTTESVDALLRRLNSTANMQVMVAINIITLIRNAVTDKTVKANDVVTQVRTQMNGIATEIADVCHNKWRDKSHHILFYMANSDKVIPEAYRRPRTSPSFALIDSSIQLFTKLVQPGDQEDNKVFAHVRLAKQLRIPSYKGIKTVIDEFTQPTTEIQMISHMPMDYHVVLASGRTGYLYRSHTGEMVKMTPENLGVTVFKQQQVPFYPITHVLLGDKYLIKGCLGLKEKRMLIAYAEKEHWAMHTNSYVRSKITGYKFTLPYDFDVSV